jgi:hypothetical protein
LTGLQLFVTWRCLNDAIVEPAVAAQAPSFDRLSAGIQRSQEWHGFGSEKLIYESIESPISTLLQLKLDRH